MRTDDTQHDPDSRHSSTGAAQPDRQIPPAEIPGYQMRRFLGAGAYGQVWVAVDDTTGRQVAVKFFSDRMALDWSLLSSEVEKLVFLSTDRYVVQLLDVGWGAEPPYYVMEYVERGSLSDLLRERSVLSLHEATELFREVAVGVSHAHSKGVLHCDLKPANILLDQDLRPRLADFGQSRLSHEHSPALGTLFYMAPEQAHLKAIPDARWDVYALGAILYCMLTGNPPHRTATAVEKIDQQSGLADRLHAYQRMIKNSPPPDGHRQIAGMDKPLAEIIDRCLAPDPEHRYAHVANILDALAERDRARARRPLLLLGIVGPLLLLVTMSLFGGRAYRRAVSEAEGLVRQATATSTRFAVEGEARVVAHEIERRFRALAAVAEDHELGRMVSELLADSSATSLLDQLDDAAVDVPRKAVARQSFLELPTRQKLQDYIDILMTDPRQPHAASWILLDAEGTFLAAAFDQEPSDSPLAKNFAYRTYFHGGPGDLAEGDRSRPPIRETHLSSVFRSTSTGTTKVALSTPIMRGTDVIGVVGMTVELGEFMQFPKSLSQCAVLVDRRPGGEGVVIEHPLFASLRARDESLPELNDFKFDLNVLHGAEGDGVIYQDPFAAHPRGTEYRGDWMASVAPVRFFRLLRNGESELYDAGLLMIVQQRISEAVEPVNRLARRMLRDGIWALVVFVLVTLSLWTVVGKMLRSPARKTLAHAADANHESTVHSRETLELPFPDRR